MDCDEAKFEIRCTSDKGRGLFACSRFDKGEIIFEEIPIVSCQFAWNEEYKYAACEFCLRPLETAVENVSRLTTNEIVALPYANLCIINKDEHSHCLGCGVKYCSVKCQEEAWAKYHKTLCTQNFERDDSHPLNYLRKSWMEIHYPPETTSAILFAKIFALIHQSEDRDSVKNILKEFCHNTRNSSETITHKLLGIKFSEQVESLRNLIQLAVPTEHVQEWISPDGFKRLLALVGTNGQGIGTSPLSQWVDKVTKMKLPPEEEKSVNDYIDQIYHNFRKEDGVGEFLNTEGSGLYKLQSMINHSCEPNAEITFPRGNHELAVVALSNIEPGEEISISYLDHCSMYRSRHSRQKMLRENYLFNCMCKKCEEEINDPDFTSSDEDSEDDEMIS